MPLTVNRPLKARISNARGYIMQTNLIEREWIDPVAVPGETHRVTDLTDAAEPQWVGIVDLGPSATYTLDEKKRHDLYVLRGNIAINGHSFDADDFLIRCDAPLVQAGEGGARLLLYHEASASRCDPIVRSARARVWRNGINPRMHVVPLASGRQHVSLVEFQPGARTRDHTHPSGEEIFVLSGELRDANERYPAGTWLRLHPGAQHAPFAEVPTVILLRHGHLLATRE
jgi:quercetin dioxygenase-like cupin family protein